MKPDRLSIRRIQQRNSQKRVRVARFEIHYGCSCECLESRMLFAAVPAPLTSVDIGNVGTTGSASYDAASGTYSVQGAGAGLFAAADAFHFVYQTLSGNGSIVARVANVAGANSTAASGIEIRSSTDPDSSNAFLGLRGDNQVMFNARTTSGDVGSNINLVSAGHPYYLELTRSGEAVTAQISADTITWTTLGTATLTDLPSDALIGLAAASSSQSSLATLTADHLNITDTYAPSAALTSSPTVTAFTTVPYQFSVTYGDNVAVQASTFSNTNIRVTGPGGFDHNATLVSTGLTNGASRTVTYSVSGLSTNGAYTIATDTDDVTDTSGNPVPSGTLGTFNVSFPNDSTAPQVALSSAPTTDAPASPYSFSVTYSDNVAVSASTLGSGDLQVTGPGGYSQPATLLSSGLTNGTSVTATYRVPAFSAGGTYVVHVQPNQVADTSGNFIAGATIGQVAVQITASNAVIGGTVVGVNGLGASGLTVSLVNPSNPSQVLHTTTTSGVGAYQFTALPSGAYRVVDTPAAGQALLEPAAGSFDVSVVDGQTLSGVNFANAPAALPTGTAGPDLTAAFVGSPAAAVIGGSKGSIKLKLTNAGTRTASGSVKVSLLLSDDGTLSGVRAALPPISLGKINLKAKATHTYTLKFAYPTSVTNGTYVLLASVDSTNAIAETTESNNFAASTPLTLTEPFKDLSGSITKVSPLSLKHGKRATVSLSLFNGGNVTATSSKAGFSLYESSDTTLDAGDILLGSTTRSINVAAGKTSKLSISALISGKPTAGSGYVIAVIDSSNAVAESSESNNTAASPTLLTFTT